LPFAKLLEIPAGEACLYSDFRLFAGLVAVARMAWKLMVTIVMINAATDQYQTDEIFGQQHPSSAVYREKPLISSGD
jgi:hypothetical protein